MISVVTLHELRDIQIFLRGRLLGRSGAQLPPGPLYHYTDSSGLLGIIKSRTLWATHVQYLNDSSEFIYARGLMKEVVAEAAEGALPGSPRARLRHTILEDSDQTEDSDESEIFWGEETFVACFSERGDGLSQWRGYGKSIGGYSLGFPFEHLRAIEEAINRRQAGHTFEYHHPRVTAGLFRCWYDKPAQKQLIREAFERAASHCETRGEYLQDAELAALGSAFMRPVSRAYKDPAFEDECEWRLVIEMMRPPQWVSFDCGASEEREQPGANKQDGMAVEFRGGRIHTHSICGRAPHGGRLTRDRGSCRGPDAAAGDRETSRDALPLKSPATGRGVPQRNSFQACVAHSCDRHGPACHARARQMHYRRDRS